MKEKISEFKIDRPLTDGRRAKIDEFIKKNASRIDRPFTHSWADEILTLESSPVRWDFIFHKDRLEVIGSGPLWAKLLFTEKRRTLLDDMIRQLLQEAGFFTAASKGGPEKPRVRAKPA